MGAGVAVEDDAGGEDAVGVGQLLDPPHQLGRLRPPLALHIRGHVDPGPVLGLERAVVLVDDQLDQAAHEGLVALEVLRLGEVRGQHEVEVAGRGVAGEAGQEAVLAEQRLQVAGALGDPLRRHADVLDDQRRARQPQPADQPVQALADPPGELDLLRLAGEGERPDRLVGAEQLARRGDRARRGRPRRRRRTRPAAPPTPAAALSTPAAPRRMFQAAVISAGATISSTAVAPAATSSRTGAIAASMLGKWTQAVVVTGRQRHRLEDDLGDEGERALGADQQAAEDLQRLVGVEEGAEPVAGRVLDRELAADPRRRARRRRGSRRGSRPVRRRARARRRRSARRRRARRCRSSSPRAGRRSASARSSRSPRVTPQRIPPELLATTPPTRGDVGAGRVGAELAPVRGEDAVGVAEDRAGPDPGAARRPPRPRRRAKWRRTSTRMPSVWPWPLRLVPPARKVTGIAAARGRRRGPWRRRSASWAITTACGKSR